MSITRSTNARWKDQRGRVHAVRLLGLGMARGLAEKHGEQIAAARGDKPYISVEELWRRADVPVAALERLARTDAFRSLKMSRRDAAWASRRCAMIQCRSLPPPTGARKDRRQSFVSPLFHCRR